MVKVYNNTIVVLKMGDLSMREIKTAWYNVAGALWAVQAVLSVINIFSGEQNTVGIGAALGNVVCYILCAVGMFSGEINRFHTGIKALSIYISVVGGLAILALLMIVFVGAMYGLGLFIIIMMLILGLVIAQYWMLTKIAEKADDNISIEKEWFMPGVLYGIAQILGYIMLGYLANKMDGEYQLNAGGVLSGSIISIIFGLAMLLTTGYAFYDGQKGMNTSGAGGYNNSFDDIPMVNPTARATGPYIYNPSKQVNNQYADNQNTQSGNPYSINQNNSTYYNGSAPQNETASQENNTGAANTQSTGSSKFTLKKD